MNLKSDKPTREPIDWENIWNNTKLIISMIGVSVPIVLLIYVCNIKSEKERAEKIAYLKEFKPTLFCSSVCSSRYCERGEAFNDYKLVKINGDLQISILNDGEHDYYIPLDKLEIVEEL